MSTVTTPLAPESTLPPDDPFYYGWRDVLERGPNGELIHNQIPLTLEDVLHPQEGDVIVEDTLHNTIRDYLADVCRARTADDPTVLVLSDTGVYWDIPELRHHSPDIAVIPNVRTVRVVWSSFFVEEEGTRPRLIIELVSPNTREVDWGKKFKQYHQAGVRHYVIIDRLTQTGPWQLHGFQFSPQKYLEIPKDDQGRLWLEEVNVLLAVDGLKVRCLDAVTGAEIGDYQELTRRLEQVLSQAAEEHARAEQEKNRADKEQTRADAEQARAEQEKARADAEAQARQGAEQRQRELEAELARLRGPS